MVKKHLWQLSNCSIGEYQNARQLNDFLIKNRRQPTSQRLIDPYEFYLRIAIITVLFQTQYAFQSVYFLVMFSFKIYYLFKAKIGSLKLYDTIVIILCSYIMPFLLRLVPFMDYLISPILVLYFFGAGSPKILTIPILLMTNSLIPQIINLILICFDQIEETRKNIVLVMLFDIIGYILIGKYLYAILILLIILIIQIFLMIDKTLLRQKRQFTHMYDLPAVKIYK